MGRKKGKSKDAELWGDEDEGSVSQAQQKQQQKVQKAKKKQPEQGVEQVAEEQERARDGAGTESGSDTSASPKLSKRATRKQAKAGGKGRKSILEDEEDGARCHKCGEPGHVARQCKLRRQAHKASQKCHLCGQRGHTRKDCTGLDDGGSGQSKYRGKYSKLPARANAEEEEEEESQWPHYAQRYKLCDFQVQTSLLYKTHKYHGPFAALFQQHKCDLPPHGFYHVVHVLDTPEPLLPEAGSPMYRLWTQRKVALEAGLRLHVQVAEDERGESVHVGEEVGSDEEDRGVDAAVDQSAKPSGKVAGQETGAQQDPVEEMSALQMKEAQPSLKPLGDRAASFVFGLQSKFAGSHVGEDTLERIESYIEETPCFGVGVMGAHTVDDGGTPNANELWLLRHQLKLAVKHHKAVYLTLNEGTEIDVIAVVAQELPTDWLIVLVDCCGAQPDLVFRFMRQFTNSIWCIDGTAQYQRNLDTAMTILWDCPLDRLVVASRSPFGNPQPSRSADFNDPGTSIVIYQWIAVCKRAALEQVFLTIQTTQERMFRWVDQL
eukprot:m.48062 g.48062  ORF g.48062 m.48062 type:complete len:548 (-) comp11008_c0_seq1:217-1860(-)